MGCLGLGHHPLAQGGTHGNGGDRAIRLLPLEKGSKKEDPREQEDTREQEQKNVLVCIGGLSWALSKRREEKVPLESKEGKKSRETWKRETSSPQRVQEICLLGHLRGSVG